MIDVRRGDEKQPSVFLHARLVDKHQLSKRVDTRTGYLIQLGPTNPRKALASYSELQKSRFKMQTNCNTCTCEHVVISRGEKIHKTVKTFKMALTFHFCWRAFRCGPRESPGTPSKAPCCSRRKWESEASQLSGRCRRLLASSRRPALQNEGKVQRRRPSSRVNRLVWTRGSSVFTQSMVLVLVWPPSYKS